MLDLALFRIRNFAVANLTTLAAYAGLIGGLFFVGLFLQQVAGYSPLEAGLATTPISILLFFLSPRFGKLASGTGPRLPMTARPDRRRHRAAAAAAGRRRRRLRRRRAAGDPRLRPRPLGDGGAADRDRARLGRGTPRRHRLGRQQRRLAGRRPAGDRRPRRRDLGPLRLRRSTTTSAPRRSARRAERRVADAKAQPLAVPDTGELPPAEATRVERRRGRRLDLGLPPRHRASPAC